MGILRRLVRLPASSLLIGSICAALLVIHTFGPSDLHGQIVPQMIDPTGRSGEPRLPERDTTPLKPQPPAQQILPPVEQPELQQDLKEGPIIRVFVTHIEVLGSTVFSDQEFRALVAPYENREVSTEDLEQLRLAITMLYVNKGYANSGAVLPDQSVTGGVVSYHVIEGRLSEIHIEGTKWFRPVYLEDRIARSVGPPFNMNPLRDRLQLLLQDERLERVNAELKPGGRPGEAVLDVRVQETNPIKAWLETNNFQPPVVGAERILGTIAHQNLTGNGDMALFTYGRSRGVNPLIETSYTLPLNRYDTSFFFGFRQNDFTAVEDPFPPLDIQSHSQIFTFSIRQPVYRTLSDEAAVSVTGEYLYNKTTLLGEPFDFVGGYQDGVAVVSALRFIQEWTHRTPSSVLAVRSRFSVGLNVLGATINSGPVADGQFFVWAGQANWVTRFASTGIEMLNRMDLQLANDRLFPLEQFPVGGRYSVRGYRENTLIRDNAFLYSLEFRLPLLTSKAGYDIVQLAPFIDVGQSWAAKGGTPSPETLASIGVGLRWNILNRANANIYWGQQLNHVAPHEPKDNLQDYGIHFQLVWNVF